MPSKNFIVAIELGSTKITGVAGQKNHDGSFTVNAVVREDSTTCIRKGVVYNADKTVQCITNIINRLKASMKTEIAQVYVGVGGQSIHAVRNVIVRDLADSQQVTHDLVNELMDTNRAMDYKDFEILDVVTQEYKVDNQFQLEPAGIECNHLEGNFLNILQRKRYYHNLNNCFERAGIAIAEMYLAPIALADAVLTDSEKRSGCMLVDFGSETTTIQVFHKNVLRHLAVIPLGSNNITKDIVSLQMEEADAEKMKLRYASAYTDANDIDGTLFYNIDNERKIESRKFIELVEARVLEIVQNAWYQVPVELTDKLVGGIIITGGGSNLKNIDVAFRNHTHIPKVRIAKFVNYSIHSSNSDITAHNGMMNTILGLLAKGEINCAGENITEQKDIFDPNNTPEPAPVEEVKPRSETPVTGSGKVQTAVEKAEEEERKRKEAEEEERKRKEAEEEERIRQEQAKPKGPSLASKFMKWLGTFTEPDE
ncbi:MAG: cell division protein FtsA [Prevotellaceae bacterium]|nr:cell division protein FtsA [Prevotellaceae bacterium]